MTHTEIYLAIQNPSVQRHQQQQQITTMAVVPSPLPPFLPPIQAHLKPPVPPISPATNMAQTAFESIQNPSSSQSLPPMSPRAVTIADRPLPLASLQWHQLIHTNTTSTSSPPASHHLLYRQTPLELATNSLCYAVPTPPPPDTTAVTLPNASPAQQVQDNTESERYHDLSFSNTSQRKRQQERWKAAYIQAQQQHQQAKMAETTSFLASHPVEKLHKPSPLQPPTYTQRPLEQSVD